MLTLRLLGPVDIHIGDRTLMAVGRDKGLTLLTFLVATAGHSHAREDLADLFWPDMPRERTLHNLRQTLLRLRELLAGMDSASPYLLTTKSTVSFNRYADHWLDLKAFNVPNDDGATVESLEQRAALYRGAFMEDLTCDISERFSQWVAERRTECQVTMLALTSALATCHERAGRLERAIEYARRGVALEPWDEAGQRRLLCLLARAGHAEAALRHFQSWREDLRRELGVDVAAEMLALAERIRRGVSTSIPVEAEPLSVERRQVTVLDCGLALDCEDDPEMLVAELAGPDRLARSFLEDHGGWIAEERPGRTTSLFGWPVADERAALHAALAALALQARLAGEYSDRRASIGIHSGLMLVRGGEAGSWHVAEQAMRLRLNASASMTVISDPVARALGGRFDLCRLPCSNAQSPSWQLVGESTAAVATDSREVCPLTGRQAELGRLTAAWRNGRIRRLHVLALCGEAGIGKSRLLREFLRTNGLGGAAVHWCECEPRRTDSPLYPLQGMLRRTLALPAGVDSAAVRARLTDLLAACVARPAEAAHRLVPFLSDGDSVPTAPAISADQRAAVVDALGALLVQALKPGTQGAVLVLEDIQWADATTLAALDALARRDGDRILVLVSARVLPPLLPWLGRCTEQIDLAPLDQTAALALAQAAGATGEPEMAAAVQAAEGIPLFIIELARMQAAAARDAAVPTGLRDLLAARLEQAGGDKPLLETAAVIGRSFETATLRGLVSEADGPIEQAIDRLVEMNLLEREAGGARFAHALVQRAAYESLPRPRRAALHRRYAEQLQRDAQASVAKAPELLAWHLTAGGLPAEAVRWWLRAAQRAAQLPAYAETAHLAEQALNALESAPDRAAHSDTELAVLLLGAYARVALGGYFDPGAQALYNRARDLIHRVGADPQQSFGVLRGHWIGASSRASHREARLIAEEMKHIADATGQNTLRGIARYLVGNSALWLGDFTNALANLDEALTLLRRVRTQPSPPLAYDQDFEATATGYLGWAHWFLGRTDFALQLGRRALALARARGHPPTFLHVATSFCAIGMGSGVVDEVLTVAEEGVRLAETHDLAMWVDIARLQRDWACTALGRKVDSEAAALALERLCAVYPGGSAGFQVIVAHIHLALGEPERADRVLTALRRSLRATEAGIFAVDRYLLESELARRQGRLVRAGAAALRAVRQAQTQGSPQLHAQAWRSLCAVCSDRPGCSSATHCPRLPRRGLAAPAAESIASEPV